MKLKVLLPTKIFLEAEVTKVVAEGTNGNFCLLPHHINFVSILVPSLLSFISVEGAERFLAVDEGILIKCDTQVWVSTRQCIESQDLKDLRQTVEQQFRVIDEREKLTRAALSKLEANLIRHFVELG
ncbi:MAG TPA: F0F1 ATP synthase subunit epsilon [Cyanothece sp. UBA12306]|nr:F0F1 ATP synthase subunit epsilon [Cyanothece sp. UBA12306]